MCNRGVDLTRIPQAGPFGNYRGWLIWKLRNLLAGESVRLPIFSAITIERWADGFVLAFATEQQQFKAFSDFDSVVTYIETQNYQPSEEEQRLERMAMVKRLHQAGIKYQDIAKQLKIRVNLVKRDLGIMAAVA